MVNTEASAVANDSARQIDELLTDAAINAFSNLTVADLLENPASVCETLSLIQNIPKFSWNYKLTEEQVSQVVDLKHASKNIPQSAYQAAFDAIGALKKARRDQLDGAAKPAASVTKPASVARAVPKSLPVKEQAQMLSPEKAQQYIEVWVTARRLDETILFSYEELCNAIELQHLHAGKMRWHDKDLVQTAKAVTWRQTVSNALQYFVNKDVLIYRPKQTLWYIFPE